MTPSKLTAALAVTVATLLSQVGAAEAKRYTYVGDRTPEAVCAYAADVRTAINEVREAFPTGTNVIYRPRDGVVILEVSELNRRGLTPIHQIDAIFEEKLLFVSRIYIGYEGRLMRNVSSRIDLGGRARAEALFGIPTSCDIEGVNVL